LAGATVELEFGDGVTETITDLRILPGKEPGKVWLGWPAFSSGRKGSGLDYQPTLTFDWTTKNEITNAVLRAYSSYSKSLPNDSESLPITGFSSH
jgi:hypothetical protein